MMSNDENYQVIVNALSKTSKFQVERQPVNTTLPVVRWKECDHYSRSEEGGACILSSFITSLPLKS